MQLRQPIVFFPPEPQTGIMCVDKTRIDPFDLEHAFCAEYYREYYSYISNRWWFQGLDKTVGRLRFIKDILIEIENRHAYRQIQLLKQATLYVNTGHSNGSNKFVLDGPTLQLMLLPVGERVAHMVSLNLAIEAVWTTDS